MVLFDVEAGTAVDAIEEGTNIDIDVLCVEEPLLIVDVKNEVFTLVAKVGLRVVRVAVDIMGVVLLPVGAAMCGLEGKLLKTEEADRLAVEEGKVLVRVCSAAFLLSNSI